MSSTLRAGECIVVARPMRDEVAGLRRRSLPPIAAAASALVVAFAALLFAPAMGVPAQAGEFDTDKWAARTLKCDGFDDNRCFRYTDRRRRNKPYLQARKYVPEPDQYVVKTVDARRYYHYPHHYRRYADMYYGRPKHHGHDHWGRGRWEHAGWRDRGDRWDRDRGDRWDKDRWDKDRGDRWDRDERWASRGHDSRYERQCLYLITTKGAEAQTENGALISAKRSWRASVRADFGERYQDLNHAKRGEYRCWRSSTNESAVGRAGEWLTGQYRKRCQVWAVPCLGDRQTLENDNDDKE